MTQIHSHVAVALFVRHPIPGRVKTRLACDLGDEVACDFYRAMVKDSLSILTTCGLPIYLFHDGQDAVSLPMEWVSAADAVVRQDGDSLGERMTAAFEFLFSIGWERVVLVGSDIPGIDAALIQSAISSIDGTDVAISPAHDGGYCLVASQNGRFNSSIFRDIPWSTSRVLEVTLDRFKSDGLSYTLLDPRQDVDTVHDIESYCRQPLSHAIATNGWLVAHGYM